MPITAAIYARKSTEQNVAEDAKSTTRQVENAVACAVAKGWATSPGYMFVDDGKSGAEFERRRGLQALLSFIAHGKAPFQRLIVSEQKSLGREMSETAYLIKQLDEAGVEVWSYLENRSLTPRDSMSKLVSSVQSYADEDHRQKTSLRVHESHVRLHEQGRVAGGRIFGYRNQHVYDGVDADGNPKRAYTIRVIHPEDATAILLTFQMYDEGLGLKRIAKSHNINGVPAPRPFQRKDAEVPVQPGHSPSTIRAILGREIYHGVVVWNKTKKRSTWGKVRQRPRPASDWLRHVDESLRIVPEDLWNRVQARRRETEHKSLRFESGRLVGRPPQGEVKNLLAGLATCGVCGRGLIVETGPRKRGRVAEYFCSTRWRKGTCANALHPSADAVNEAVLRAIEEHALTPEAVEYVIRLSERDDIAEQQDRIGKEAKDVARRIRHLVDAIEAGGEAESLVAKLRDLEAKQQELRERALSFRPVPRLAPSVVTNRLDEWRRHLRGSVTQGRAVLQRLLPGRIVFTPRTDGKGYDFAAPTRFDKLFSGIVVPRPSWIPEGNAGAEHLTAEDTFDGDYGRLLERAAGARVTGKGVASPSGIEPESRP